MNIGDVDLNLLRVLDALLRTNSVAGAADQLHLSAPAVSRSLGRLRRLFDDPLFVRAGRHLVPTPRATELRPFVSDVIENIATLLTPPADFDPRTLTRRFSIRADEAIVALLAMPLLGTAAELAPHVEIDFLPESTATVDELRNSRLDLAIGVHRFTDPDIEAQVLLTDNFVAAVRVGHALTERKLTAKRYAHARHLTVSPRARRTGPIDEALASKRLERTSITTVPTFMAAAHLVATTDLVGSLPRTLVDTLSDPLGLVALDIPVPLPTFDVRQHWHRRTTDDPGHRFFRTVVTQSINQLR